MTEQSLLARSIRTILFAGVSSAFFTMPAMAQQAQQSSQELVDEEQEEVERVTVTG